MDSSPMDKSTSFFIRPLDRTSVAALGTGVLLNGVFHLTDFLTEEGRQFLEGQIFAYGSDIRSVCRTVKSRHCPDEIVVPRAEEQIPVIGEFAAEFNQLMKDLFPLPVKRCLYQLRVYEANYGGHPEHVDYAPGYTIKRAGDKSTCLTSLSYSLPISWNEGIAPEFHLVDGDHEVRQHRPGSLVVFGPRIRHSHPAAPQLNSPYAWLTMQSFHEGMPERRLDDAA
jgi:hypothetical protein